MGGSHFLFEKHGPMGTRQDGVGGRDFFYFCRGAHIMQRAHEVEPGGVGWGGGIKLREADVRRGLPLDVIWKVAVRKSNSFKSNFYVFIFGFRGVECFTKISV